MKKPPKRCEGVTTLLRRPFRRLLLQVPVNRLAITFDRHEVGLRVEACLEARGAIAATLLANEDLLVGLTHTCSILTDCEPVLCTIVVVDDLLEIDQLGSGTVDVVLVAGLHQTRCSVERAAHFSPLGYESTSCNMHNIIKA